MMAKAFLVSFFSQNYLCVLCYSPPYSLQSISDAVVIAAALSYHQ